MIINQLKKLLAGCIYKELIFEAMNLNGVDA